MPIGIYIRTKQGRENMSKARLGYKDSKETIEKKRKSKIGNKYSLGIIHSKDFKLRISKKLKGRIISQETRDKISKSHKGKKLSDEHRKKLSESHKGQKYSNLSGAKAHNWKGGITPENKRIRQSIEFRLWRESVFARDNWTCQKTGIQGMKLHPHHIQNFHRYPELRFAIDNGITLSEKSHKEFHKKYGIKNNTKEQLKEFLEKAKNKKIELEREK